MNDTDNSVNASSVVDSDGTMMNSKVVPFMLKDSYLRYATLQYLYTGEYC